MADWYFYMNHETAFLFGLVAVILNELIPSVINQFAKLYFIKTGRKDKKYRLIIHGNTFVSTVLLFSTILFLFGLLFYQLYRDYDEVRVLAFIAFISSLIIVGLFRILAILINYKSLKIIRDKISLSKRIKQFTIAYGVICAFLLAVYGLTAYIVTSKEDSFIRTPEGLIVFLGVWITLLMIFRPFIMKILLHRKKLDNPALEQAYYQLTKDHIKSKVSFHSIKLSRKPANALVSGLFHKRLLISETLVEKFTHEEILSVLAHEAGHIKKKHIPVRFFLLLVYLVLFYFVLKIVNGSFVDYNFLFITILSYSIIFGGLVLPVIYRMQERQADAYVLELGIDYRIFAAALLKIAELNKTTLRVNRVRQSFRHHPSMEKRVNWLIRKSGGSYEEVEKYQEEREDLDREKVVNSEE